MPLKIALLMFCLIGPLVAKQSAPMQTQLLLESKREVGANIEYKIIFRCTPQVDSEKMIFTLKVPPEFSLELGFAYWEGEVQKNKVSSHAFTLMAPASAKGKLVLLSKMMLEKAQQAKNTVLELSKDEKIFKASIANFNFSIGSRPHGRRILKKRILRQ